MPYPGSQYFYNTQKAIFEPVITQLSESNMECYRVTPDGGTTHSLIVCDSAWDSKRNGSTCFHPVLTLDHGQAKVIAKGTVSRHYTCDPPEKDENGNFVKLKVGDQNYHGTSPGMVVAAASSGLIYLFY